MEKHADRFFEGLMYLGGGMAIVGGWVVLVGKMAEEFSWPGVAGVFVAQYLFGWLYQSTKEKKEKED